MAKHPIFDQKHAEVRESMFADIEAFIFQFSQLEYIIRMELVRALRLKKEQIAAVTGPYDFAALCNVTKAILTQKNPEKAKQIEDAFNRCLELNTERVRVVHGLWTLDDFGARAWHVSRNKLKAYRHFQDPDALARLTELARRCMIDVATITRDRSKDPPETKLLHIEVGEAPPKARKAVGNPKG